MNKSDIVSHGSDHVNEGVLLHLDRGVGDEDQRVQRRPIRRQHVVDLRVHASKITRQHLIYCVENHSLTSHLLCRDIFVSFYENWCTSTHQPRHLLGILLILLLDISPPDSVKEDFSFEPLKYSLFNFLSILKFLSISRPKRKGKRDPLICLSFGHWNIFSLVFFASYSNFGYFFTRLCKGKL